MRLSRASAMLIMMASAAVAVADEICFTDTVPLTRTNWSDQVSIPKFDPSWGTLLSVKVTLKGLVQGTAAFESLDAAPATIEMNLAADLTVTRPDNSTLVTVLPVAATLDNVTAFDGVVDFGGTSGRTYDNLSASDTESDVLTSAPDLALFTGAGNIDLPVFADAVSSGSGAGNLILLFTTDAAAEVEVCYNFRNVIPAPGAAVLGLLGLLGVGRRRN